MPNTRKKGLLSINEIKNTVSLIINNKYKDFIDFIYLYSSYVKCYLKEIISHLNTVV